MGIRGVEERQAEKAILCGETHLELWLRVSCIGCGWKADVYDAQRRIEESGRKKSVVLSLFVYSSAAMM